MTLHTKFYSILNHKVLDWFRDAKRSAKAFDKQAEVREDQYADRPDESVVEPGRRVDGRRAIELLRILTERERRVYELHFFEGLSTSQIAERLGIPEGTVCYDLSSGRNKLREKLLK
jgi:RNA polymerase sigma-70 factor (ECF subfamily)